MAKIDKWNSIIGDKYGKLQIKEFYDVKNHRTRYKCLCECGNEKIVVLHNMKTGNSLSCGCLKQESMDKYSARCKSIDEIGTTKFSAIKAGAISRNISFKVSREYIWNLYLKQNRKCVLSGLNIEFSKKSEGYCSASLDRIDSNQGYIEGNVQWVHKDVNLMKLNHSQDYFIDLCKTIANHSNEPAQKSKC